MARTIIFVAEFTKSKVKTTPANAPTIDIADMLAPTASLLVSGGSPTQLTNMTGVYIYSYSAADSVLPVGLMRTADSTVDLQDVPCLPLAFDANGFLKADVEDWKGAAAPAMTGDAYARLGAPAGASISADIAALPAAVWAVGTRTLTSLSAHTAAIAQAVWEYATRTITGGGGSAADIWAYATRTLTQAAASVLSAVQSSLITEYRGETWSIAITGLGALTGYSKIYFAIKAEKSDADSDALVFIEKTAGLTRLNGAAYATAADGSITIDSEGSGNITITVKPAATALLTPRGGLHYGVKMVTSGGVVRQLSDGTGKFNIAADVPRAIS